MIRIVPPAAEPTREDDDRARRVAQSDFTKPLVLEAGAGTGKTTVLTTRVLAWSLGPGWERARAKLAERGGDAVESAERIAEQTMGAIAAITFTEAAAAEMATRIEEGLCKVAAGEAVQGLEPAALEAAGPELRTRADALRGALDHLDVRTIHAWCRGLLADFPIVAGLHPAFSVDATFREQAEVLQEVLEESLGEAYASTKPSPLLTLAAEEQGPEKIAKALGALLDTAVRAEDLEVDPLSPEAVRAWLDEIAGGAADVVAAAVDPGFTLSRPADVLRCTRDTADRLAACEGDLSADELEVLCADLREIWAKRPRDISEWARESWPNAKVRAAEGLDSVAAAARRLKDPLETALKLRPQRLVAAHRALRGLLAEVERRMRTRGAVSYGALLRGARDLLRDHPGVAATVRGRLDQLLVDEFQDTDAIQCDLVRAVALEGEPDERPGLFVVGDPKQSIYAFRGADLAAYDQLVGSIEEAGGEVLPLCVNFRSVPAVLDEVRRIVAPVMHEEVGLQPPFQPLLACDAHANEPGFERGSAAAVEHWVSWDRDKKEASSAADVTRVEAQAFARDVRRLRDEHEVPFKHIALLVRSRTGLEDYLEALRDFEIPYVVSGDRSYYKRREVIEAAAALRCVLDRNDHLALLAFLRSSVVGVPDAALIPLWARELPTRVGRLFGNDPSELRELVREIEDVAAALPAVPGIAAVAGWEHNLAAALRAIAFLRKSFEDDPPDRFVENLRAALLPEASESGRFPPAYRVGNLEQFYRELANDLSSGEDERAVLRRLRTAGDLEREADEPAATLEDAVLVGTIHGAKGLGFEHVYLAQVGKMDRPHRDETVLEHAGRVEYQLLGTPTLGFASAKAQRDQVEAAELVRTLYVGLTRAKQRLVVMGARPKPKDEPTRVERARSYGNLLEWREPGADDGNGSGDRAGDGGYVAVAESAALSEAMSAAAERGDGGFFEPSGVRWHFPALDTATVSRPVTVAPPPLDLHAASAAADALAAARAQAAQRMARPLRSAASRASHSLLRAQVADAQYGAEDERASAVGTPLARDEAMTAGTAVHALLEDWDLGADPQDELARQRARIPLVLAWLGEPRSDARSETLRAGAEEIFDAFAASPLFERFTALGDSLGAGAGPALVARELPVWLAPQSGAGGAEGGGADSEQPLSAIAGAIDLVYRDADGALVVVDYKTDRVGAGEAALAERAAAYAEQGRYYVRALHEGLGLEARPRFELWFLRDGRVVPLAL